MDARKLKLKVFVEHLDRLELESLVPVFHGWIRDGALDEPMIDVADYRHVPNGPGVVLIGHGSDYYLDQGEGRLGLLYSRKRQAPSDPTERLFDVFTRAFAACRLLENEAALGGRVRFRTDELLFQIPDRLGYPNTPEVHQMIRPELEAFVSRLYAGSVTLEPRGGPREQLGVAIRASRAPSLDTLMKRLGAAPLAA